MFRRAVWTLVLALGGCGSDDDSSKGCPDLDSAGPTFAPLSAKSGAAVVATFPLEPGSPGGSCPISITLTCGKTQTSYKVDVDGHGVTEPLTLDCAGEAAPTKCQVGYTYETPNSVTGGSGQEGPTCEP